jgi:hypothetical protein
MGTIAQHRRSLCDLISNEELVPPGGKRRWIVVREPRHVGKLYHGATKKKLLDSPDPSQLEFGHGRP